MRRARRFPHARRLLPRSQTGAPVQPCDLSICPPFRLFIAADDRLPESCGTSQDNVIWLKRSEEHTSELQSLMRISYAVFCLKKKIDIQTYVLKTPQHITIPDITTQKKHYNTDTTAVHTYN